VREIVKYLLLNIGTWVLWFYLVGFTASKLKISFLAKDYIFTKLLSFEKDGSWFRKYLKIDKWKDRVPELGGIFGDGFQKRSIDLGTKDQLQLFIRETRRAELAHWVMTSGWIITIAFNPLWAIVFNLIFAHIVNFPCLIIQRYNRARLIKVLENRT
jgi:glycosyl-4,4'-diaponeurosporenoate acyltransferase